MTDRVARQSRRESAESRRTEDLSEVGRTAFGSEHCGQMVNDPTGRKGSFQPGERLGNINGILGPAGTGARPEAML